MHLHKDNRGAFLNFLHAKYEAHKGNARVRSLPYYLCIDPCDICQLQCPTCPTGMENASRRLHRDRPLVFRRDRTVMSMDLFEAILDELGDDLFLINFYNYGEPLLNRRLPEMIRKAAEQKVYTDVNSHLSMELTNEQIEGILSSGLDNLTASVDGFSQEAYQVHRVNGNVALVKKNLERLAEAKARLGARTRIAYKFLVFSHNEHETALADSYCRDIGVEFEAMDAMIFDRSWLPSHRGGELPLYSEAENAAIRARWSSEGVDREFDALDFRTAWLPNVAGPDPRFPGYCSWHYGISVITAAGGVSPCCASPKQRDDFGRVVPGVSTFADAWNGERIEKARAAFAGKDLKKYAHVETMCTRCHFPRWLQHLYSAFDNLVYQRFEEVFGTSEPEIREGLKLAELASRGNPTAVTAFKSHFESMYAGDR